LRSVILKARAVALENAEHHRAAEADGRRTPRRSWIIPIGLGDAM
jgi:hypothetical protein